MNIYENLWFLWISMNLYECLCFFYKILWIFMNLYEILCFFYWFLWILLFLWIFLWISMCFSIDFYDFLWISLNFYDFYKFHVFYVFLTNFYEFLWISCKNSLVFRTASIQTLFKINLISRTDTWHSIIEISPKNTENSSKTCFFDTRTELVGKWWKLSGIK